MKDNVSFQGNDVLFREYNFENDPPKLVKYLFNQMNSKAGISELRVGDSWFHDNHVTRVRLVAEINGELYATATLEGSLGPLINDKYTLFSVVTAEKYRGTGLSQLLINFACQWAKNHSGRLMLVETWESNERARKFYEKIGFHQFGILPNGIKKRSGDGFEGLIYYFLDLSRH